MKTVRTKTRILRPNSRNQFFDTSLAEAYYREDGTHVGTMIFAVQVKPFLIYHPPEGEPERPGEKEEITGENDVLDLG